MIYNKSLWKQDPRYVTLNNNAILQKYFHRFQNIVNVHHIFLVLNMRYLFCSQKKKNIQKADLDN